MSARFPVLLCGGSGIRLWSLLRMSYPEQLCAADRQTTLFRAAAQRPAGPDFATPVAVTGGAFSFIVAEQLAAAGIVLAAVLIQPEGRNTAPPVLAANVDAMTTFLGRLECAITSPR